MILATWEAEVGVGGSKPDPTKLDLAWKTKGKRTRGMAQVVEHLAWGPGFNLQQQKIKNKNKKRKRRIHNLNCHGAVARLF
jgi:hypothetical protein